jgi:hypothetical protein
VPLDHVAPLSSFSMTARAQELVVGRDCAYEGLVLPETTLMRVEEKRALDSLTEFGSLSANWDGYGALPIAPETIKNGKAVVAQLIRQAPGPDITPNPNGTLFFEWVSPCGAAYLEMGKTRFSFFVKPAGGVAIPAEGAATEVSAELGALIAAIVFPVRSVAATTKLRYTAGHERDIF